MSASTSTNAQGLVYSSPPFLYVCLDGTVLAAASTSCHRGKTLASGQTRDTNAVLQAYDDGKGSVERKEIPESAVRSLYIKAIEDLDQDAWELAQMNSVPAQESLDSHFNAAVTKYIAKPVRVPVPSQTGRTSKLDLMVDSHMFPIGSAVDYVPMWTSPDCQTEPQVKFIWRDDATRPKTLDRLEIGLDCSISTGGFIAPGLPLPGGVNIIGAPIGPPKAATRTGSSKWWTDTIIPGSVVLEAPTSFVVQEVLKGTMTEAEASKTIGEMFSKYLEREVLYNSQISRHFEPQMSNHPSVTGDAGWRLQYNSQRPKPSVRLTMKPMSGAASVQ